MTEIITVAQPPKSLVQQAMEKDWDPDRLKQIIDLQVAIPVIAARIPHRVGQLILPIHRERLQRPVVRPIMQK